MKKVEIRWHSRAGQGAITASEALIQSIGTERHTQSFPEFGAEKRGAPVVVFTRISDDPLEAFYKVIKPNYVILFDMTLLNKGELLLEDVIEGLDESGTLIINAKEDFDLDFKGNVYRIDATGISMQEIGKNIPNVPMVAALLAISGIREKDQFAEYLKKALKSLPENVLEGNLRAFDRAYNEIFKIR